MSVNALSHKWNVLHGGLECDKHSDLRLVTESGESVLCHKVVLTAVSGKVKASLEKKQVSELVVRNVKFQGLKSLIKFIYNGKIQIPNSEEMMDFCDCYTLLNVNLGPKIGDLVKKISMNTARSESDREKASQENLFKCANCDKHFPTRKQLTRHVREVHNKQDAPKPKVKQNYSCENCGTIFTVQIIILTCA